MITSPSNPLMKEIRRLRNRKFRQESGLAFVEGIRQVIEVLNQPGRVEKIIFSGTLLTSHLAQDLLTRVEEAGVSIVEVSNAVFESISMKDSPVGLAAVVHQVWHSVPLALAPGSLWVALESVADPGNLGTILRTLDATAGDGVILLDHATDPYDPTAIRASMGAVFTQCLVRTSGMEFSRWVTESAIPLVGASDKGPQDYHRFPYPSPCLLLMGSERQGLSKALLVKCQNVVAIPMSGSCDSLNLGVAASLILYEIYNQRRMNGGAG